MIRYIRRRWRNAKRLAPKLMSTTLGNAALEADFVCPPEKFIRKLERRTFWWIFLHSLFWKNSELGA